MPKIIEQRVFPTQLPRQKRVAAYARVSSAKDAMHHSLAAQVSHYSSFIQAHPGWEYAGVYADEAKTGTKDSREQFQKMLDDCRAGRIDAIMTKSISRFARNTVTLLETVRELKSLGIDVHFEEQNIHTLSEAGEVMVSILASFAQAESQSVSENQKWRVKKNFSEGKPWRYFMLGYRNQDGKLTIIPEEAEIVRSIFADYLAGDGFVTIANRLNESGIKTQSNCVFHKSAIERILRNYTYTGNLILQTKYREDYLTKKTLVNHGELPKYHVTESHEAIIDLATFEAVQAEMERRKEKFYSGKEKQTYPYTGKIICGNCGKHYRRKTTVTGIVWICSTYNTKGKAACASKQIPEEKLMEMTADTDLNDVEQIVAENGNQIRIRMTTGEEVVKHWQDRSRAESWTDEMKEQARQKQLERSKQNG